jgi:hypothetical protein
MSPAGQAGAQEGAIIMKEAGSLPGHTLPIDQDTDG